MYAPTPVPNKAEDLPRYLSTELQALAQSLQGTVPFLLLQTRNAPPVKPRDGMIARADGTNWNPGSGSGFYGYRDAGWHLLG